MSRKEADFFWNLIANPRSSDDPHIHSIIEIGSWKGKSTILMAYALNSFDPDSGRIFCVDHFQGSPEIGAVNTFPEFFKNLVNHYADWCAFPIPLKSADAALLFDDKPFFDLLYIDAAHDYENVSRDFTLWSPKVRSGGIVAFHDAAIPEYPDVARFLREVVEKDPGFELYADVWNLRAYRKK